MLNTVGQTTKFINIVSKIFTCVSAVCIMHQRFSIKHIWYIRKMIISHSKKFIFVKTVKTGGTSLESYLSAFCDVQDVITPIYPAIERHYPRNHRGWFNFVRGLSDARELRISGISWLFTDFLRRRKFSNHLSGRQIRARVGHNVWRDYFTFCVERNPWDKTLSHYHMLAARSNKPLSLDAYFAAGKFPVNVGMYTNRDGALIVDRVLRFERLGEELVEVGVRLGLPLERNVPKVGKVDYRSDRRHYTEILSTKQIDQIARVFAAEITLHGYEVESPKP